VKTAEPASNSADQWQKTHYANLVRYKSSGIYFARIRVKGKLIRKSLKTDSLTVAKLRLADLEKVERQRAESSSNVTRGKLTFGDAVKIYAQRVSGDVSMKPRTKEYYEERTAALLKSWPDLAKTDIARLTKTECLNWAADFGKKYSSSVFNNTVKILRDVIKIGIESGARYDNPALSIKRASLKQKKLQLPEFSKFPEFVSTIAQSGGRFSRHCADLVEFLSYGGFRISESGHVQWQDCDFESEKIMVFGDPENRTKNGEFRVVPMIPNMAKLLGRLKQERPDATPTDINEVLEAMFREIMAGQRLPVRQIRIAMYNLEKLDTHPTLWGRTHEERWGAVDDVAQKLNEQLGKTVLMTGAQLALRHIDESQKQPKAKCPFTPQREMITKLWGASGPAKAEQRMLF
jgi:integrase